MTQPDQLSPSGQFSPISGLQSKSEDDWMDEIRAGLTGHFDIFELALGSIVSLVTDLFGDIVSGTVTAAEALATFVTQFTSLAVSIPQSVIGGLGAALDALLPWDLFTSKVHAGANLVIDPGFENASVWQYEEGSQSTDQAYLGTHSWKVTGNHSVGTYLNTDGTTAGYNTSWLVRPGQTFKINGRFWRKTGNSTAGVVYVVVQLAPATGGVDVFLPIGVAQSAITAGQWNEFTANFTVPVAGGGAGPYKEMKVLWVNQGVGSTDVFYLDDVSVRDIWETQGLIDTITNTVGGSLTDVTNWIAAVLEYATDQAGSVLDIILDTMRSIVVGMLSAFSGIPIINLVTNGLADAAEQLFDYASSLFTTVSDNQDLLPTYGTYNTSTTPNVGQQHTFTDVGLVVTQGDDGVVHATNLRASTNGLYWGRMPAGQLANTVGLGANGTIDLPGTAVGGDAHVITAIGTAGDAIRGEYDALPTNQNYKITIFCEFGLLPESQTMGFLMLRSSGGAYMSVGIGYVGGVMNVFVHKWNSATSFNSVAFTRALSNVPWPGYAFLQVEDDGTNRAWRVSLNGWDWYELFSETRTTFMTAASYGWGAYCTASGITSVLRVRSLDIVGGVLNPGYGATIPNIRFSTFPPIVTNQTQSRIGGGFSTSGLALLPSETRYGDLILVFAYNANGTTIPTAPGSQGGGGAYTTVQSDNSSGDAFLLVSKVADLEGSQDTGTFTNADMTIFAVLRGAEVGASGKNKGSSTTETFPTLTLQDTSGKSWEIIFVAHDTNITAYPTAATGSISYARQFTGTDSTDLCAGAIYDSNGGVSSSAAGNITATGFTGCNYQAARVELKAV